MCYKNEYQKRAHGEVEQIFRELLPEAGLHVREEQIRLCHEMLDALMKNEITLCDAGVGIGKTYAYLTACILMRKYSVLHSGYSGCDRRSVVVSTSSIALQELLCKGWFLPPNTYDCGSFVVNGTAVVGKEPKKPYNC